MFRLRLPQLIHDDEAINLSPKSDDDQQMGMKEEAGGQNGNKGKMNANKLVKQQILADVNWTPFLDQFAKVPKEKLVTEITHSLLQTPSSPSQQLLEAQAVIEHGIGPPRRVNGAG